ncbi:uncharacterized protein KY384_003790 [Bacidia gigantensis]|uniref:uncharacterized protein n=1 Tax=Bacidia gigantensis TaxID=2732470 RepID=UPI001D0428F0|nr:uncharacterized protein KY384_003790 [Bacidia gigantensis]KAG8532150.1 hypothetical protein KY384_003790 [Bacidia gigantensis]
MSYRNGYTNGTYGVNRYEDNRHEESLAGDSGRTRRPGGYGGFHDNRQETPPAEPDPQPPLASFRRRREDESSGGFGHFASGRRDTDEYNSSRSRDRGGRGPTDLSRLHGGGPGGRQIEDVLHHINDHWDVMAREDCVPIHVALQLMDYSSLGRGNDYQDFQKTSKYLQKALKAIVNEHHQGFNSSIGTFHKIQNSIQASQSRIRALKDSMRGAKENLTVTKSELKASGTLSQHFEESLQILGQIERLQLVPEQLDARISDKHFLTAVDLLQDALRMIRKAEMENIGALTDLRIYFSNQETSLTDILVEELHDHLYLKSPYCHDRWKPYNSDASKTDSTTKKETSALPNTWGRPLYRFLDNLDTSKPLEDDASRNPEVDSFQYIHMVIESLHKLGHLDVAVDRLEQRLPVELFSIVDRTNQEVDIRHAAITRGFKLEKGAVSFKFSHHSAGSEVLNDLLWSLYSKFEAIAEGHRAVHEILSGILKRDGIPQTESLTRGFKEMWKLYQSEMRSLLHDYLAADGNQSYRLGRQPMTNGNIFHSHLRERNKRVFKLAEVNSKSTDFAQDQQDLDRILEASVPGLVSKSQRRSGITTSSVGASNDGPAAGHKLLVEPNVFNIGSLLPPTLSFLQRLRDIVPHDADIAVSTLTSFLDEFLVNVFHPSLEDTVTELCRLSFSDLEAFKQDPQWAQHATKPIFKGTSTFFVLIKSFCQLLDTIPPDLTSTQLIITQVVTYYDRCCEWYRALVRRPQMQAQEERRLKPAAIMAESGEVRELCERLFDTHMDGQPDLLRREVAILIDQTNATPLEPFDIIADRRSVTALCLLSNSMQWLASHLQELRRFVPESTHKRNNSQKSLHTRQLSLYTNENLQIENAQVYLPMTSETVTAFDSLLSSIRSLASNALITLHLDIRLGIIHMLARTMAAPYLLGQLVEEPDPSILSLNSDLLSTVDTLSTYVPEVAQKFIMTGLAHLVDTYLVHNAAQIKHGMNRHGCDRMQLNIIVLTHNLNSIPVSARADNIDLSRSAAYYDLFGEGAESIVSRARDQSGAGLEGFDLEELKTLVELWYKEGSESSQREVQVKCQRDCSDKLLVLSECLWNSCNLDAIHVHELPRDPFDATMQRILRLLIVIAIATCVSLSLSSIFAFLTIPEDHAIEAFTAEQLLINSTASSTLSPRLSTKTKRLPDSMTYHELPGPIIPTHQTCLDATKCYCCRIAPHAGNTVCAKPPFNKTLKVESCACWQLRPYGKIFCSYPENQEAEDWVEEYVLEIESEWLEDEVVEEVVEVVEVRAGEAGEQDGNGSVVTKTAGDAISPTVTAEVKGTEESFKSTRPKLPEECRHGRRARCLCWADEPNGEVQCENEVLRGKLGSQKEKNE